MPCGPPARKERRKKAMASPTETPPTKPDMRVIWKIATPDDLEKWNEYSAMLGSDLDKADGFSHSSNGEMVKKVASMFFKDRPDCVLLRMEPSTWPQKVVWTTDEPTDKAPPPDGSVLIHHLPDGCSHVFSKDPLPMTIVSETFPMPLKDGTHVFPEGC